MNQDKNSKKRNMKDKSKMFLSDGILIENHVIQFVFGAVISVLLACFNLFITQYICGYTLSELVTISAIFIYPELFMGI